jgi:hypothetical protein
MKSPLVNPHRPFALVAGPRDAAVIAVLTEMDSDGNYRGFYLGEHFPHQQPHLISRGQIIRRWQHKPTSKQIAAAIRRDRKGER